MRACSSCRMGRAPGLRRTRSDNNGSEPRERNGKRRIVVAAAGSAVARHRGVRTTRRAAYPTARCRHALRPPASAGRRRRAPPRAGARGLTHSGATDIQAADTRRLLLPTNDRQCRPVRNRSDRHATALIVAQCSTSPASMLLLESAVSGSLIKSAGVATNQQSGLVGAEFPGARTLRDTRVSSGGHEGERLGVVRGEARRVVRDS